MDKSDKRRDLSNVLYFKTVPSKGTVNHFPTFARKLFPKTKTYDTWNKSRSEKSLTESLTEKG